MFAIRFAACLLAGAVLAGCQPQSNEQHADRNPFYQGVKIARVVVSESYGPYKGIALPFKNHVESWLRMANIAVTGDEVTADVVIRITAEGEPLKANYGSRQLYTGARLQGTIRIERPSIHQDELSFFGKIDPPPTFITEDGGSGSYERPENAPFVNSAYPGKTAFDGFKFQLATLMGRYFGRSVLLIALDDYNSKGQLRESAIEALVALGKPAVPYLIDAFLYCSPEAEQGLGEALEKITGVKYGSDAKRWNEWLSQQDRKR